MSAVITGKSYLFTKMDRYNKYQTKQYTHAHTFTSHTQQLVASTWLGYHQGRPSAPLTRFVKTVEIWSVNKYTSIRIRLRSCRYAYIIVLQNM